VITTNILYRMFFVHGEQYGSAFALDRDKRQYLVTARHIVGSDRARDSISIYLEKSWKALGVKVVGLGNGDIDVAVLSPAQQIAPNFPLEAAIGSFILGQDMLIVGYPLKMSSDGGAVTSGRPVPFVRKGVLSAFDWDTDPKTLWIDAVNNEGFSGGPILFQNMQSPLPAPALYLVAGVVSKYKVVDEPVLDAKLEPTGMCVQIHAGFTMGCAIKHVLDLIDSNPIGFVLPPE
jgi:hypothetical protein